MSTRARNKVHEVTYTSKAKSPPNFSSKGAHIVKEGTSSDGGLRMTKRLQAEASLANAPPNIEKKFEYGSKLREKKNYVYYVSGVGYVSKDDEPKPEPKPKVIPKRVKKEEDTIIERKKIIDNYQYHETKNLRKPDKTSNVFHRRLAQPFEVTQQIRTSKATPYYETSYDPKRNKQTNSQKYYYSGGVAKRNQTPKNDNQYYEEFNEGVYYQEPPEGGNNFGFYESRNAFNKGGKGATTSVYYQRTQKSTSSYSKGNSNSYGTNSYNRSFQKNGNLSSRGRK